MTIKTIGELKKWLEGWADFVEIVDDEFTDALFEECNLIMGEWQTENHYKDLITKYKVTIP